MAGLWSAAMVTYHSDLKQSARGCTPVDGRLDALHEDVGGQPAAVRQPLPQLFAIQVVAAALALSHE